jgi:hypothetical protein
MTNKDYKRCSSALLDAAIALIQPMPLMAGNKLRWCVRKVLSRKAIVVVYSASQPRTVQRALIGGLFLMLAITSVAHSYGTQDHEIQTQGRVCANPSSPCQSQYKFATNQLSFNLPMKLVWQNNYYSAPFYAIILKSIRAVVDGGPDTQRCLKGIVSETERQRVQAMFPTQKVIASTFGCYLTPVWYTSTRTDYNFLAVYAGETQAEAVGFLAKVKATGQFPCANIRKMQVVLGYGD